MSIPENRIGIKPIETVSRFEVSTADVRDWIQKRVNRMIAAARKEQMDKTGKTDIPDINVNVLTYEFSKKFAPFLIMLPEEVIIKDERNSDNTMKIFLPDEGDQSVRLLRCVWAALVSFVYTKDEKKEFLNRDSQLKQHLRLTRNDCGNFAKFCSPKIMKSGSSKVVVFMLDPIKIFSEMVRGESEKVIEKKGDNPRYRVVDITFERINSSNFKYSFDKVPRKRGDKGANFDKKILRAMKDMMA